MNSHQRRTVRRLKEQREQKLAEKELTHKIEMVPNPTLKAEHHPWRDRTNDLAPPPLDAIATHKPRRWYHIILCEWLGIHCQRCIDADTKFCCLCGEDLNV